MGEQDIDSKYYLTWEEYKAQHPELESGLEEPIAEKLIKYEDMMFDFVITLLT